MNVDLAQRLVIDQIAATPRAEVCVTSSFQAEDMVVVHMVRQVFGDVPVIFLDTGYHFAETIDTLDRVKEAYGIRVLVAEPALSV